MPLRQKISLRHCFQSHVMVRMSNTNLTSNIDYRPEAARCLRDLLEERMDEELEQYLGRAKHE